MPDLLIPYAPPLSGADISALASRLSGCLRDDVLVIAACSADGRVVGVRSVPLGHDATARMQAARYDEAAGTLASQQATYCVVATSGDPGDGLLTAGALDVEMARSALAGHGLVVRASFRVHEDSWRSYDDERRGSCRWWAPEASSDMAPELAAIALAPQPERFAPEAAYAEACVQLAELPASVRMRRAMELMTTERDRRGTLELTCLLGDRLVRDVVLWRLVVDQGVPGEPGPRTISPLVVDGLIEAARTTPRRYRTPMATLAGALAYLTRGQLVVGRVLLENAIACGHGARLATSLLTAISARTDPNEIPRHALLTQAEDAIVTFMTRAA